MSVRKFGLAAALAVVGVLMAPPTSEAAFLLRLSSGGNTTDIDLMSLASGSGGSGGLGGGAYTYTFFFREAVEGTTTAVFTNLRFAGYTISGATNITNMPGDSTAGNLSLNGLTISRDLGGSSAEDITVAITATGYSLPSTQRSLDSNFGARLNTGASTVGPAGVTTIDFRSSFAFGESEFGDDISNKTTTTNFPFSETALASLSGNTGSYSLTNLITITNLGFGRDNRLDQGGVSSLVTPEVVPAPTGVVLALGAVPFLAFLRRKRQPTRADRRGLRWSSRAVIEPGGICSSAFLASQRCQARLTCCAGPDPAVEWLHARRTKLAVSCPVRSGVDRRRYQHSLAHDRQVSRQVGAFLREADAARQNRDVDRETTFLRRYLKARPTDLDARERLGRLMSTPMGAHGNNTRHT